MTDAKDEKNSTEVEAFPDTDCTENFQPIVVSVIERRPWTFDEKDTTNILICRELTPEEVTRLGKAKTREEIDNLLYLIKNINEPIEYEVDLRTM